MPTSTPTESIPSIRALAKRLDRSHTAVRKWTQHPEWLWTPRGPWSASLLPKMREWAALTLKEDRAAESRAEWAPEDLAALKAACPDLLSPESLAEVNAMALDSLDGRWRPRDEMRAEASELRRRADEAEAALAAEGRE